MPRRSGGDASPEGLNDATPVDPAGSLAGFANNRLDFGYGVEERPRRPGIRALLSAPVAGRSFQRLRRTDTQTGKRQAH